MTTISGGISNALYKVEKVRNVSMEPYAVVLRVYGDNTEKFVNREEEVEIMQTLHKEGFGPKVCLPASCNKFNRIVLIHARIKSLIWCRFLVHLRMVE